MGESFNWPCALRVTAGILPPRIEPWQRHLQLGGRRRRHRGPVDDPGPRPPYGWGAAFAVIGGARIRLGDLMAHDPGCGSRRNLVAGEAPVDARAAFASRPTGLCRSDARRGRIAPSAIQFGPSAIWRSVARSSPRPTKGAATPVTPRRPHRPGGRVQPDLSAAGRPGQPLGALRHLAGERLPAGLCHDQPGGEPGARCHPLADERIGGVSGAGGVVVVGGRRAEHRERRHPGRGEQHAAVPLHHGPQCDPSRGGRCHLGVRPLVSRRPRLRARSPVCAPGRRRPDGPSSRVAGSGPG